MNKFIVYLFTCVLLDATFFTIAYAQIFVPAPTVDEFTNGFHHIHLYGKAEVSAEKANTDDFTKSFNAPDFSFIVNASLGALTPAEGATRVNIFLAYNRGGTEQVKFDSLRYAESIAFAETGTSGFLGNIAPVINLIRHEISKESYDLVPFYEFAFQQRNVIVDSSKSLPFGAFNHSIGLQGFYGNFGQNRFRFILCISYNILAVISEEKNFLRAFEVDSTYPTTYRGFGFKVGVEFNDLTASFQAKHLGGTRTSGEDAIIDKITGWQAVLSFSVMATILSAD